MSRKSDNAAERHAQADRMIERERRTKADRRKIQRPTTMARRASDRPTPKKT